MKGSLMKCLIQILLLFLLNSNLSAQEVIATTSDHRTIEYSYDDEGKLIKNFSIYKKVQVDSLKQYIEGEWQITKYISWEKEKPDSLPRILRFEKDNFSLINGALFDNTTQLNGTIKILPNNAEGAELLIENILPDSDSYKKIEMCIIHCEENILFMSIIVFSYYGNQYKGVYKLVRKR